jgi:hypothetical protein
MLPLGGYVKMLDEREAPVDPAERHLAFNTQPLKSRAAVVVCRARGQPALGCAAVRHPQLERIAGAQSRPGKPGGRVSG